MSGLCRSCGGGVYPAARDAEESSDGDRLLLLTGACSAGDLLLTPCDVARRKRLASRAGRHKRSSSLFNRLPAVPSCIDAIGTAPCSVDSRGGAVRRLLLPGGASRIRGCHATQPVLAAASAVGRSSDCGAVSAAGTEVQTAIEEADPARRAAIAFHEPLRARSVPVKPWLAWTRWDSTPRRIKASL